MSVRFKMKQHVGSHTMTLDGVRTRIVPGDVIKCDPYMLNSVKDKFEQLDPDPLPVEPEDGLKLKKRDDGTFDVVNSSSGQVINDVPLNAAAAYLMVGQKPPLDKIETGGGESEGETKDEVDSTNDEESEDGNVDTGNMSDG